MRIMKDRNRARTKTKIGGKQEPGVAGRTDKRSVCKKIGRGGEVWQISSKGARKTVVTSRKSAAAMDEAVRRYASALRRLADR
ncbi:MAG: hypothetical protein ACREC3_00075 [Methyloceanibacter sp.]